MSKKKKDVPRNESVLKAKPIRASRSEMAEVVLPAMTNPLGKLLGGHVMHLVDIAAAMAASRHSNSYVVTASVDYIDFRNPINIGAITKEPRPVAPLILKSADEKRRWQEAGARRKARLALRYKKRHEKD